MKRALASDFFHENEDCEGEDTEATEHPVTGLFVLNPLSKRIDSFEVASVGAPY